MTELEPPTKAKGDTAHALARAVIGSAPLVGNAATEFFNLIIAPPIEKRLDDWRVEVGERLKELEDARFVTVESLQSNEAFVSTITKASQIAVTAHDREKREALRNAVLNTALSIEPDDTLRQLFLRFVDELTPWHIRILHLLHDAHGWFVKHNRQPPEYIISGSLAQLYSDAYPELKNQRDFLELLHSDLVARKLSNSGNLMTVMSGSGPYQKRTTAFGDRFLAFISEPEVGRGN
jgi:hypothetical protein